MLDEYIISSDKDMASPSGRFSSQEVKDLKTAMAAMDSDGDGLISFSEFASGDNNLER